MNMRPRFPTQPTARRRQHGPSPRRRMIVVVAVLSLASLGLVARAFDLQVVRKEFYQSQGDARFLREVPIAVSRGTIFDRNGEPLAVSTPVMSIWANPSEVLESEDRLPQLAKAIGMDTGELKQYLMQRSEREFVYLRRQMRPDAAQAVLDLGIPGVNGQREYRRYYPSGEVTSHILGFTNIDDHGQEGLELAFDDWLAGKPGAKRVIRDRMGHIVEDVEQVRAPQPGRNLTLSIDRRIQFLAYNELKNTLEQSQADSGSMVIIDVTTGEVLAMVNLPTYNPNALRSSTPSQRRNRSMTDVVEPGSTIKPVVMAAALSSGKYTPNGPLVDTGNGHFYYMTHDIRDTHAYGMLSPTGVIQKSSNIGAARLAMKLTPKEEWEKFSSIGLGQKPQINFPGVVTGRLRPYKTWRPIEQATMAYGYGLSASLFQLARAYTVFANDGVLENVSMLRQKAPGPGPRVFKPETVKELNTMLQMVASPGGTAPKARTLGYSVGGKSGTAYKAEGHGYAQNKYRPWFVGLAPISHPRIVVAVMVDEPTAGLHYGGDVAAPVFSQVVSQTLPLLGVAPDLDVRTQITQTNVVQIPEN